MAGPVARGGGGLTGSWSQQVQEVYNALVAKGQKAFADKWKAFAAVEHKKQPDLSVTQVLQIWIGQLLASGVSGAVGATATATSQIAQGAAKGAEQVTQTISGIPGAIASALESGFLAIIKDIWNVIIGPLEIVIGFVFIILALFLGFKDDLFNMAMMAAR